MAYADYSFYTETYLGQAIDEADFPRLSLRASTFLDYFTQGRAAGNAELDAVKMACCAVAEQYQIIDALMAGAQKAATAGDGAELQSQTVGSWSKSYRSAGETVGGALSAGADLNSRLSAAVQVYLGNTGLLYRGCCL